MRRISREGWRRRKIAEYYQRRDDERIQKREDNMITPEYVEWEKAQERAAFESKMRRDEALEKQSQVQQRKTMADTSNQDSAVPAQLKDLMLIFAGNAYFTIRNNTTGNRFTFRVSVSKPNPQFPNPVHFVSVLCGPDNRTNYAYIGFVSKALQYRHAVKSIITEQAVSVQAFKWLLARVATKQPLPPEVQIWHEGRCCRCGRMLTVPESIEHGLGPECYGRI